MPCKSEVSDFDIQTVVEKNVFRLQVPVSDIARMNVVDAFKDLSHDEARLLLRQCHNRREIIEEFTVTTKLKDQEDESVGLEDVLKLN